MGSAFHQLCPRYSGTLTPLPLRLLGYGKPLPFTPSPVVAKSPVTFNSKTVSQERNKSNQQIINNQSHVSAQNIPVEIPHAQIIGAENPVNSDQSAIHGD